MGKPKSNKMYSIKQQRKEKKNKFNYLPYLACAPKLPSVRY